MSALSSERRRYVRVPVLGPIQWRSGDRSGCGRMLNTSPGGTAFEVAAQTADRIGPDVTLDVELAPNLSWRVTQSASVLRREAREDGMCTVAVAHPPGEWEGY